jgi:hypothetical protein
MQNKRTRQERSLLCRETMEPEMMRDVLAGRDPGPFNEKLDPRET